MAIVSICMTILMAVAQVQPSIVDSLRKNSIEDGIRIEYEFYTTLAGFKTTGNGSIELQGNAYHMRGNGMEIYCDGSSTWLIDQTASEVVIESADSKDAGLLANPIILLMNIEESKIPYKVDNDQIIMDLPDGTRLTIRILSMSAAPTKKPEAFRPPTEFSDEWVVTDLR